nr:hypothetical protein [Tanacetum cinerariifolium]
MQKPGGARIISRRSLQGNDRPIDWVNPKGQQYPHNLLKPLPLIPNSRGHHVIPFDHFINNDLEYLRRGASSRKYTTTVTNIKAADYGHIKWIEDVVPRTMWIQEPVAMTSMPSGESSIGGANVSSSTVLLSTESLLTMSTLSIESSLLLNSRLRLQKAPHSRHRGYVTASCSRKADKSDSQRTLCFQRLSLNVYMKHRDPKACGRPSTRCRKLPEEAQPNKDKYNRLMRIDKLHKFSDGTLTVRTTLDDRLKGIRMKYLPHAIWRKSNKEREAAMIQAIDKMLKTMMIMRSLERFVGGRLYEGDFRML